jgi:2-hydroxy-3-oxopropionate reductase
VAETIGFIGLGIMGRPMAANLVRAGRPVVAYNRSRGPLEALARVGARPAGSVQEVAARSDVTITMLPDSPQVIEVMDDVLAGAAPGQLVIDMSTISPVVARQLAERAHEHGVEMLDAPVSGGDVGAQEGTLSIMVGGDRAAFERAYPILEVLGATITHVGDSGAGQVVKACNQIVVAVTIEAVSEALVLGSKAGVDPGHILNVLGAGLAANRVMEVRRRNFLEHDFTPGFRVDLHHKDLTIALTSGDAFGVPLPVTGLVQQLLRTLRARGQGGDDHSALLSLVEDLAQHRISPRPLTESA